MRITPEKIASLAPGEIFVFGSNKDGKHDGGAARTALNHFGAIYGQSSGLQGQSYGVNTMSGRFRMEADIRTLIRFSERRPDLCFLVTELGCGIAGYIPEEVAPVFKNAILHKNIYLSERFWKVLMPNRIK